MFDLMILKYAYIIAIIPLGLNWCEKIQQYLKLKNFK